MHLCLRRGPRVTSPRSVLTTRPAKQPTLPKQHRFEFYETSYLQKNRRFLHHVANYKEADSQTCISGPFAAPPDESALAIPRTSTVGFLPFLACGFPLFSLPLANKSRDGLRRVSAEPSSGTIFTTQQTIISNLIAKLRFVAGEIGALRTVSLWSVKWYVDHRSARIGCVCVIG